MFIRKNALIKLLSAFIAQLLHVNAIKHKRIWKQSTTSSPFPACQLIVNSFIYSENPSLDSISIFKTRFHHSLSFHCQSANWFLVPLSLFQIFHLYLLTHYFYFHTSVPLLLLFTPETNGLLPAFHLLN